MSFCSEFSYRLRWHFLSKKEDWIFDEVGALHFIVNWKDGIETLSNGKPVWNKFSKNWHVMIALKSLKIALKGRDRFCRKCVRRAWYPTSRYARQQIGYIKFKQIISFFFQENTYSFQDIQSSQIHMILWHLQFSVNVLKLGLWIFVIQYDGEWIIEYVIHLLKNL